MPPKGWKKQSEETKSSSQGDETDTFSENKGEHGASDKGLGMSAVQNKEKKDVVSLDDLLLPKSIISRIAKSSIPEGSTIPSDGQLALQRSASVFISYLCSEANEFAAKSKRKTIMPQDISKALEELEFASFIPTVVARVEEFEQGVLAKKKVNEEEEDEIEDDEILEIEHGEENADAADEPPSKKHKGRKPGRKAGSGTSSSAYASAGLYKKKSKMNEDDDDEDDDEEDEEDEEEEETTKKRGRKKGTDDTDKKTKGRKKKDEEDKKERKKPGRKKKGPKPGSEEGDPIEVSGDQVKSQSKEPGEPSQPEEPAETKDDNSDEETATQV